MRTLFLIAFLFTNSLLFGQRSLFGVYERKWSAHSSLTLFPDSTFEEKYISFSCGNYAAVFEDSVFKGKWTVNRNSLKLKFYPTRHNSGWNVSNYFIDTAYGQLVPQTSKETSFLNYVKTKGFDNSGAQNWEINPYELITRFDSVLSEKSKTQRGKIITLLAFWLRDAEIESSVNGRFEPDFYEFMFSSPYNVYEQVYFIGRLKHGLSNPKDTVVQNFIKAGLKEIAKVYKEKFIEKYKNKSLDNLLLEDSKDGLNSYVAKQLSSYRAKLVE
jgi:hypothetical protein